MRLILSELLGLLLIGIAAAQTPPMPEPPLAQADIIHVPEVQSPPTPPSPPTPGSVLLLATGQWYVVDFTRPLIIDVVSLGGSVTMTTRKGPLVLPIEIAPGYKPDASDPDVHTFAGPYIYVFKVAKPGDVLFGIVPSLNALDGAGKPVAFTKADLLQRRVTCLDGPQPPPAPPVPVPPTPTDPFQAALQDAYRNEGSPDKANQVKAFANFYRNAANTTAKNSSLLTLGDFVDTMALAVKKIPGLPAGSLAGIVKVIAPDEAAAWGTNRQATLSQSARDKITTECNRVAAALEGLR